MKLWASFWFELIYQARRVPTWLYFAVLVLIGFAQIVGGYLPGALTGGYLLSSPFVIANVTGSCCLIWLLMAAYIAGDAAARDVETAMHPLTYCAPVAKAEYLGGRFAAAFVLNALILLAVPVGIWLGLHSSEVEAALRGPFQPAAYLAAYAVIALPTAFVGTAVQFSSAALSRRAVVSYTGGLLLLVAAYAGAGVVTLLSGRDVGPWLNPIGVMGLFGADPTSGWTTTELSTRLTWLDGSVLANRLLWIGVGLAALGFTHARFRFAHPTETRWWSRSARRDAESQTTPGGRALASTAISAPRVERTFGFRTRARQTLAIAWGAFARTVRTWPSLLLLGVVALFAFASVAFSEQMGVPQVPRTDFVLFGLENPGFPPGYLIIPFLTIYWAGELVWRERDAGLSEIVDAAPVPDWVLLLGKFLGLGLLIAMCIAIRMTVGILYQAAIGQLDIEIGRYVQVLFGLQLTEFLLPGLLVLVIQELVSQKQVAHLVTIVAYVLMLGGPELGVPDLLAFGFDPGWTYTEMSGFGASFGPWIWYQAYWAAWALLLAVAARLFLSRGREGSVEERLRVAVRRFRGPTAWTGMAAVALILALGGLVFYNTRVLTASPSTDDATTRLAEYERRYARFATVPQPRLTGTSLEVEIDPEPRRVDIRGTYRLVNDGATPIDSVQLATAPDVETSGIELDRAATNVLTDDDVGVRIYALQEPLQPGDALSLSFEVHYEPRGFRKHAVDAAVVANGTYLMSQDWLPAIGYQRGRELRSAGDRSARGLSPRPAVPSLYDVQARRYLSWTGERTALEATVGTSDDQVAIAPGGLRETWTEGGRRYFHYATDVPIGNEYVIASADYAVREASWDDVAIQIFHDPEHTAHLDRVVAGAQAALDHYTEAFGPYPYSYIKFVEQPGPGGGLHSDAGTIAYREWFTLMNPDHEPGLPDVPFAVVAHEVGHQWWGAQLRYAPVEGAGVLSESLAWYSAMGAVRQARGPEELHRLLDWMREPYPTQPANVPLLRASDDYQLYRKGPFTMYALSEYVGEEQVDAALWTLLETHASSEAPLPTTLDLYRELRAVAPDSLQPLLHDLFEVDTLWELETERAVAEPSGQGMWQVTLDVRARKVVTDTLGGETEVPLDDLVQVGVFALAGRGEDSARGDGLGEPLYLGMHRVRSTESTITVTVPARPSLAGIDPYHLLDWEEADNVAEVEIER